jgi:hypothetical protein
MSRAARAKPRRSDLVEIAFLEGLRRRCPANLRVLEALGALYTKAGLYEAGLHIDLEMVQRRRADPVAWYNLGCSYALLGRPGDACDALERAATAGYADFEWMAKDRDLKSLHGHPRFETLLRRGIGRTQTVGEER